MEPGQASHPRPLSPHLQIYRWPVTMATSILHRITGIGLYGGTILVVWWLVAAVSGPDYFAFVNGIYTSWFGLFVLFCFTWALIHHALGGVRHFVWDVGAGFSGPARNGLAWVTAALAPILTVLVWLGVYLVR